MKTGVEPEVGEMDPKLAEALNAFGSSRYDECRKLAEDLISAGDNSSTRAECVGIIILSHLQQGDFDGARKAAERLGAVSPDVCQDLLQQVSREERDYQAKINPLQEIIAISRDPAEKARAELQVAHAHRIFGRLEMAENSYQRLIEQRPKSPEAASAVSQLASLAVERGDYAAGIRRMEQIAGRYPKTLAALRAYMAIPRLYLAQGEPELAVTAYSVLAKRYPKTPTAVSAEFAVAGIYLAQDKPERAIETYAAIAKRYPKTQTAVDAEFAIAKL